MMKSYALLVNKRKLHFRHAGEGPPIFLFHASPMSSTSLQGLILKLAPHFTVIAPDTPGYGLSQGPITRPNHIGAYVDVLQALQTQLNFPKIGIYGTATGAQIGIRYALKYPAQVSHLFLDNTAHFTEEERTDILEHYFPDYTPQLDGSHLIKIWDTVTHLFQYFPWCFKEEKYKLTSPTPPDLMLHRFALEYIRSGPDYDWAYRLAFAHEDRANICKVTVPTHIFRWESSILGPYMDRIFEIPLPSNIDSSKIKASDDRHETMSNVIRDKYQGPHQALKISRAMMVGDKSESDAIQLPDISFPTPESSGRYLVDAWKFLAASDTKSKDLNKLTARYVRWASSIL